MNTAKAVILHGLVIILCYGVAGVLTYLLAHNGIFGANATTVQLILTSALTMLEKWMRESDLSPVPDYINGTSNQ